MDNDFYAFQELINQGRREKGVFAKFYDRAVRTTKISEDGLPVYEMKTYVEIRMQNNNTEVYDQPATEDKINRFSAEYQSYLLAKKQQAEGTPLEMFAFLDAAEIATLKNRGVFTVEVLAKMKKEDVERLGFEKQQERAAKFLEASKNNVLVNEFAEKEEKYKDEISRLSEEIKRLKEELAKKKG